MSMLAERKRKTKYSLNPRGNQWVQDSNKFGQKMLEKMGWKHGKGLGAKEDGITEQIKVAYKNDSKGMGYKGSDDQWTEHEDKFAALLSSLTGEKDSKVVSVSSLEQKSQSSRARVHYKKFTQGKDLSRYSEKDLASIFGKRSLKDEREAVAEDIEKPEEIHSNLANNDYLVNGGSMADYFKNKLTNFYKASVKSGSESESEVSHSFGFGFKNETAANQENATFVSYISGTKRKAEKEEFSSTKKAKKEIDQEQEVGVSNPAFNPLSTPVKVKRHVLETIEESVNEELLEVSTKTGDAVNLDNSLDHSIKKKQNSKKKDLNSEREEYTEHFAENINVNHVLDDSEQQSSKGKKKKSKDKSLVEDNPFEVKLKKKQLPMFAIENSQFLDAEEPSLNNNENIKDNPYELKTKKKKSKYAIENPSFAPIMDTTDGMAEDQQNSYEVKVKTKKKKYENEINHCSLDSSIVSNEVEDIQENPYEVKIKRKKGKSTSKNSSLDLNYVSLNGIDNCTFDASVEPSGLEEIKENPYEVKVKKKKAKSCNKNGNFDMNIDSVSENGFDNCTFDSSVEINQAEEIKENPYEVKIKKKKVKHATKDSSCDTHSISKNGIDNCTFDARAEPNVTDKILENPYEVKIKKKKAEFAIENPSFDINTDCVPAISTIIEENPYEVKVKKKKNKYVSGDTVLDNINKKSTLELESLTCENTSEHLSTLKSPCEFGEKKKKKKQKQIEGISNSALEPIDNNIPNSNDIVVDDQLMLNVAVIPETKSDKPNDTPQSVKRKKSVRFSNINQKVTIPNENASNGIDNQCFDKQKSMLDENMQFISKTLDRFEAEIENDLNEEKQLMIGEVGNPSGNHQKLPDGTVKLKFRHADLQSKTPMYHLDKTGARKSYKHLIKGDIVLHFKETNLHTIEGYAVKKETIPPVKLCPFVTEHGELDHYICLRSERCCAHGCCFDSSSKLLILVLFGTFYFLTWYCKKIELRRKRRAALAHHAYLLRPPPNPNTNSNPTTEFVDLTDEIYAEAVNMPKLTLHPSAQEAPLSDHQVHRTDSEPLPTYDSVVKPMLHPFADPHGMDPKLVHYCNYRHYYKEKDLGRIPTISRAVQENDFNKNVVIKRTIFGSKCVLKVNEDVNVEKRRRKARIRLLIYVSVGCINETALSINDSIGNVTKKHKERHIISKNLAANSNDTQKDSSNSTDLPLLFCKDCNPRKDICFKESETDKPKCMEAPDINDPTGCGGFCQINTHFCQTLDAKRKVYQCLPLKSILRCPEGFFSCDYTACQENELPCSDGFCIEKQNFCDGQHDCIDGSDEPDGCQT
nr:unnamed protein product [Callosobruchus analis]